MGGPALRLSRRWSAGYAAPHKSSAMPAIDPTPCLNIGRMMDPERRGHECPYLSLVPAAWNPFPWWGVAWEVRGCGLGREPERCELVEEKPA